MHDTAQTPKECYQEGDPSIQESLHCNICCVVDEHFPMHLWDKLLPQTDHMLNLWRQFRLVPMVPDFAHLYSNRNYNVQLVMTLGYTVEIHVILAACRVCAPHSVSGFYISTLWKHYQFYKVWVKDTKVTRIGYTVFFKHTYLMMPTLMTDDALIQAAGDLTKALDAGIPQTN